MAYLVGMDEAGYGPNLGPLVIAATVWRVPEALLVSDQALPERLSPCVCSKLSDAGPQRLAIADSKKLYKPGGGLAALERGVFTALELLERRPRDWKQAWQSVSAVEDVIEQLDDAPWRREFQTAVPLDADLNDIGRMRQHLAKQLTEAEVALEDVRATAVFPRQFNEAIEHYGNKGAALSHITMELLEPILDPLESRVLVHCDKHGGRNRYAPLLQHFFPGQLMQVKCEGRAESSYAWGPAERRRSIRFVAKGDHFLPAALASMFAKWLRELAMRAFNEYWRRQVPDLKPTAGYPVDAKRFYSEIREAQSELGIEERLIWRAR